jgi:hypothetical protein
MAEALRQAGYGTIQGARLSKPFLARNLALAAGR